MASDQFSLCWDNFHKNMSSGMQSMLENEDLVDVTLAVEGRYLKAHKMVLSVCSPYFRELFQSNPCKHPIVFMKDVSYIALSDLLQFMYQGEVQVAQENLPTFIKTAEALQIKGLTGDNTNPNETDTTDHPPPEVEKVMIESAKRTHESVTPKPPAVARVKKPAGPASKRPRFTLPPADTTTPVAASTPVIAAKSKSEGAAAAAGSTSEDVVQFKMEPSEGGDSSRFEGIDDTQSDAYGDDSALDDMQDDTDDYPLMEGGEEEPKAGTSADGTGDGQAAPGGATQSGLQGQDPLGGNVLHHLEKVPSAGRRRCVGCYAKLVRQHSRKFAQSRTPHSRYKCAEYGDCEVVYRKVVERKQPHMTFIRDGFVYHQNSRKVNSGVRYLACSEYKKLSCRARATLPIGGTIEDLFLTQEHNHPPSRFVAEKALFIKQLKSFILFAPHTPLKEVYQTVQALHPQAAELCRYNKVLSSMRRWRNEIVDPFKS